MIAFHYHAFNLYIALLVDAISVARDAIRNCRLTAESAKGEIRYFVSVPDAEGTMVSAHALYWEGIILARVHESWTQEDSERYQFIVAFFKARADYAPSTFHHKAIFLEGNNGTIRLLTFLADLLSRQREPGEELNLMENAIKLAKEASMFHVTSF